MCGEEEECLKVNDDSQGEIIRDLAPLAVPLFHAEGPPSTWAAFRLNICLVLVGLDRFC